MRRFRETLRFAAVAIVANLLLVSVSASLDIHFSGNASAAVTEVAVGWMNPVTMWNPMNPMEQEDFVATYLMFSTLFTYDQDLNGPVNDLVKSYDQEVNPNGTMTTTLNISSNAYFRNKAAAGDISHKLTADDVKYTLDRIMAPANVDGTWASRLHNITSVTVKSNIQLEILTDFPEGTLIDELAGIPIIPRFHWQSIPDGSSTGRFLDSQSPASLIGSGPFYYSSSTAASYRFVAAPNYHGETDYGSARTVKVGSILYTIYDDADILAQAMNSGQEDTVDLTGYRQTFSDVLGVNNDVRIYKQNVMEQGICDIAINAIPLAQMQYDTQVVSQWRTKTYGTGNPILQDPTVRKALAMTVNKTAINESVMDGLATVADSVVPLGYWHNSNVTNLPFSPAAAKSMLNLAGYKDTDSDGILEVTATAYVAGNNSGLNITVPEGTELAFRLYAPATEADSMVIAERWVAWARQAGISLQYRALSEPIMNADWYKADFDILVRHWQYAREPIQSLLKVWLTDEIMYGGLNCQGPMGPWWYGPGNASLSPTGAPLSAFDQNWTDANGAMDIASRKAYYDLLQQMIFDSFCEVPPFYDLGLFAFTDERFDGWGDWRSHPGLTHKSGLPLLWFNLEPIGNTRPIFDTPLNPSYTAIVNQPITFEVIAYDVNAADVLYVNWSFGDGSPPLNFSYSGVSTPTSFSQMHTYSSLNPLPGYVLNVTLWDGQPDHEKWGTSVVYVVTLPDTGPIVRSVTVPPSPRYNGTMVTWSVGASDNESGGPAGYGLLFTWHWGDGTHRVSRHRPTLNDTVVTDTQTKSWPSAGTYAVQVFVWDGFGLQTDPTHNVSSGVIPYEIIENSPPRLPNISPISASVDSWVTCIATSADPDPDPLRFTWDWGDGHFNVTDDANLVPGSMVESTAMYNWSFPGTYPVVVHVDDLSGLFGHNSSLSVDAAISAAGVNVAPTALIVNTFPEVPYENTSVRINASAVDADADALTFFIEYGDGSSDLCTSPGGTSGRQFAYPERYHSYTSAASYTLTLHVDDGQGHNVSMSMGVDVVANDPPWLILGESSSARYNSTFWIEPTLVIDNDTADAVSVWYDWGDATPMTMGDPLSSYASSHRFNETGEKHVTVWADDGTGKPGHNVSRTITVTIIQNLIPLFKSAILKSPLRASYNESESITFTFTIWDYEGDGVVLVVEWGDGQSTTEIRDFGPNQTIRWNLTHSYASGRIDAYVVNATLIDGADHYHPDWNVATTNVKVVNPTSPSQPDSEIPWAVIGGVVAGIALGALAATAFLRKRAGKKPVTEEDTEPEELTED